MNKDDETMIGRMPTRENYDDVDQTLSVYHVELGTDKFFVFANCEAAVRLVIIDRKRIKQRPNSIAFIRKLGPAMTSATYPSRLGT